MWALVDKILCSMWLCVHYVAATYYTDFCQTKPKLAFNSEGTDELLEDDIVAETCRNS
jgi:hypothetical protein